KLIRGLTSEAPAGFRSRRGPSHDSTLVTPHNAPFSTFITLLGGAAAAWPLAARAQRPGKLPTIGFQGANTASSQRTSVDAFVQRLRELGWTENQTVAIEYRWGEGRDERFAEIAAEFVQLKEGGSNETATGRIRRERCVHREQRHSHGAPLVCHVRSGKPDRTRRHRAGVQVHQSALLSSVGGQGAGRQHDRLESGRPRAKPD